MNRLTVIATLLLPILLAALPLRADRTLRGRLRTDAAAMTGQPVADSTTLRFDTIMAPRAEDIKLSGYDKPLASRVESLFVTNVLNRDICSLEITLTYTDMQGRTLHEATRRVRADVPAGTTRRVQFPSWDTQNSFYYRLSRRPRTANVTPYDVTCRVVRCILLPADTSRTHTTHKQNLKDND